jgi:hypothetical protein
MSPGALDLWANLTGFAGTALILAAYAYQTVQGQRTRPALQHGLNFVGALLLIASLLVHVNMASLVLESVWAVIALFGMWQALRSKRT